MTPMIELKSELEGIIKLEVIKEDGTLKEAEGLNVPFKNLITDAGLNSLAAYNLTGDSAFRYCRVGTSSTPPTVYDTTLGAQTGSAIPAGTATNSLQYETTPYYSQHKAVYTFNIGDVSGNLTEIGFFTAASGGTMWSRALIKDSGGNPTTLTLLATEQLKVTYTVIRYIPTSLTGSFTLNTNGTNSTINYTITPANLDYLSTPWSSSYCSSKGDMVMYAFETDILGPVTYHPSGSPSQPASSSETYISGSFQNIHTPTFPVTTANFVTGIGSIIFWRGDASYPENTGYQCSFSPKIMKTPSQTLSIGIKISWGRTTQQ